MSTLKDTWNQTHPAVKTGVVVVGVAVAGFILYKIYKGIVGLAGKITDRKEGGEALQDILQYQAQGIYPTLTDSDAETFVNAIKIEVNKGMWENTSEQTIFSQLSRIKNVADWAKVKYRWGVQTVDGVPMSLTQALVDELSDSEKQEANSILFLAGVTNAL